MTFIFEYMRLIFFALGLLIGIQVPSLVDQYTKRVDAHLVEARQNLSGFQQTADRYFSGSIENLISHYRVSDDPVFRGDADSIQSIFDRKTLLAKEMQQLNRHPIIAVYHAVFSHQPIIMQETLGQFSYAVLLNPQALLWGISLAFILSLAAESILRAGLRLAVKFAQKPIQSK